MNNDYEARRELATERYDQEARGIRAVALIAASTFCAPNEASDVADVLRIAEQFAYYVANGSPYVTRWAIYVEDALDAEGFVR